MKELMLIRHGEASHHIDGMTGGWTDSALTVRGHWQASRVAEHLAKILASSRFELFSSDLMRARDTAQVIAHTLGQPVSYEPDLRELNNGVAKDKLQTEARLLERPRTEPVLDWVPYQDAESWRMLHHRILGCMERVRQRTNETAIIISHGNAIVCIIHWWLRITEDHHLADIMYETGVGAVAHLKSDSFGCRVIHKLNDTSHLDE